MTQTTRPANHSHNAPLSSYTVASRQTSLVKIGGALGVAATFIALAVFLVACFGFDAVFMLSPLALVLAAVGFVLTVIGAVMRQHLGNEEAQPIAAVFVCLIGIVAGLIEMMFLK
jgi:FtsH-binding integral membrane protein